MWEWNLEKVCKWTVYECEVENKNVSTLYKAIYIYRDGIQNLKYEDN